MTNPSLTTIPSGGFLLLWADKMQKMVHSILDFKLSNGGEDIILISPDGSTIIDQLTYNAQSTNTSYGRIIDGGPDFQQFIGPTPGMSNDMALNTPSFAVTINTSVTTSSNDAIQYGNSSGGVILDAFE